MEEEKERGKEGLFSLVISSLPLFLKVDVAAKDIEYCDVQPASKVSWSSHRRDLVQQTSWRTKNFI